MQVRRSPLPYLLLFCALSSVITQDASPNDTSIEADGLKYLDYLNGGHFEGSWESTSSTQTFGAFEENSGFFVSKNLECIMPVDGFKLNMTVYDGKYLNGDSLEISICHRFSASFRYDPANLSFIGTDVPLKVSGKGTSNKKCISNITIYFIDQTFDASTFDAQIAISSSACSISLITDILTYSVFDKGQQEFYAYVFCAFVLLELIFGFCILVTMDDSNIPSKISIVSYNWLGFYRLMLLWSNGDYLVKGIADGGFVLAVILVIGGFVDIFMIGRGLAEITKYPTISTVSENEGSIAIFVIITTWNCLNDPWSYFPSCLYLLPQILERYRSEENLRLIDFLLLLNFTPALLFHIGYFSLNSNNFARLKPYSDLFWIYVGLFATQIIVLIVQNIEKKSRYQIQTNEMVQVETGDHKENPEAVGNPAT